MHTKKKNPRKTWKGGKRTICTKEPGNRKSQEKKRKKKFWGMKSNPEDQL